MVGESARVIGGTEQKAQFFIDQKLRKLRSEIGVNINNEDSWTI